MTMNAKLTPLAERESGRPKHLRAGPNTVVEVHLKDRPDMAATERLAK